MTRKGDTVLAAALKRYGKKLRKYIQSCLNNKLKVKILVEDQRDPRGGCKWGCVFRNRNSEPQMDGEMII